MQHSNPSSFWFTAAHCPSAPQSHAGFIMTHKDSNIDRCTLPGRKYWQMSNVGRPPHMRPPCSITITWFWPKSNTVYRDSFYMDLIILVDDENSNSQWANIWFRNMLLILHTNKFCVEIKLHSLKIHSVSHHIPQSHFIGMQYLHDVCVGFVFNYV